MEATPGKVSLVSNEDEFNRLMESVEKFVKDESNDMEQRSALFGYLELIDEGCTENPSEPLTLVPTSDQISRNRVKELSEKIFDNSADVSEEKEKGGSREITVGKIDTSLFTQGAKQLFIHPVFLKD